MTTDKFGRPFWRDYFMAIAFVASQRSIDPNTKHGCVITTKDNRILTLGYNGPPRGSDDERVPLMSPEKYHFMLHAESNAIDNSGELLQGGVAYVTGKPCSKCLGRLIQNGIAEIVYGPVRSVMVNTDDEAASSHILDCMKPDRRPVMVKYGGPEFVDLLAGTIDYAIKKCAQAGEKISEGLERALIE